VTLIRVDWRSFAVLFRVLFPGLHRCGWDIEVHRWSDCRVDPWPDWSSDCRVYCAHARPL